MATETRGRPPFPPHEKKIVKSIRVKRLDWKLAEDRAASEGKSIQEVIRDLLEGYSKGKIDAPKTIKSYS